MTTIKSGLFALALASASFGVSAQVSGGGVSGGGISGISGVSGGLAIDFAASQVSGATTKRGGGLASSLEAAFAEAPKPAEETSAAPAPPADVYAR